MEPQLAVLHEALEDLRGQLLTLVESLAESDVNRSFPGLQNTIGILLRHMAASENYWIRGVAGGGSQERKRDTEFGRDPLVKADLLRALREAGGASTQVLAALRAANLQDPVQAQRSRGTFETTKGFAILHALQHLAYHLGQIRLMAALARHGRETASV